MLCAVERFHTFDGQQVRPHSADLRAHVIQKPAKLLHVRLAGCIVNCSGSIGEDRRHNDVRCSGDRSFVQEHIRAFEVLAIKTVSQQFLVIFKRRPEVHHALKMGVQTPTTDLIAAGFRVRHFAQTSQERTDEHHRATQFVAFLEEISTAQIRRIEFRCRESIRTLTQFLHAHTDGCEQINQVVYIEDVRQIVDHHRLFGQQHGTQHLQRFVLGALRRDTAMQFMSSFYNECSHIICSLLRD